MSVADHPHDDIPPSTISSAGAVPESTRRGGRETPRQDNTRSSLFEKLPPDLRRAVNVAIIERVPSTYQAVWMQFELGKFGVSFSAFYRYARRLRDRVNLVEAAGLAAEDDAEIDGAIRKLASRRLLELLLNTDGAELNKEIAALLSAQHQRERITLSGRRLEEHAHLARARLELDREQLRLKSELLQSARDGVLTLINEATKRGASTTNLVNLVHSDEAKKRRRPTIDESSSSRRAEHDQSRSAAPHALPAKAPSE